MLPKKPKTQRFHWARHSCHDDEHVRWFIENTGDKPWENKHLYQCCKTICIIKANEFVQSWNTQDSNNHKQNQSSTWFIAIIHTHVQHPGRATFISNLEMEIILVIVTCSLLAALFQPWRVGTRLIVHSTLLELSNNNSYYHVSHWLSIIEIHILRLVFTPDPASLQPALIPWLASSWKLTFSFYLRRGPTRGHNLPASILSISCDVVSHTWVDLAASESNSEDRCEVCWTKLIKPHPRGHKTWSR